MANYNVSDFFLDDNLLETATYAPAVGSPSTISVHWNRQDETQITEAGVNTYLNTAICIKTDIPSVKQNETLKINSTTYYITRIIDDGTGFLKLELSKTQA